MAINKQELINKIQEIDSLSMNDKSALMDLIREQKKYGLVWEEKPENVEIKMNNELPVLLEDKDRAIVGDAANPNHILIEGDNLHALVSLTYTNSNQIDVIYIDPPYNTGNRDFMYNDCYVDKEDGYRL